MPHPVRVARLGEADGIYSEDPPMYRYLGFASLSGVVGLMLLACATDEKSPSTTSTAGGSMTTPNGGMSSVGGSNSPATGGTNALGVGGSIGFGGQLANGGATLATGGIANSGGSATGGVSAVNGGAAVATGGSPPVGGSSTGGKATSIMAGGSATGGNKATGGSVMAGGNATGGNKATGGSVMAGGSATGGSSGGVSTAARFSFFVTSQAAMVRLSGSSNGFGGDLRYGEADGLAGADKICTTVAESAMPGAGAKGWRAFLSATVGPNGNAVNAIDRVGPGPWYDRLGRVVALNPAALANTRPQGADTAIVNDLPNESGIPNHSPDGTTVDNHDTLTGSNAQGQLGTTTRANTCNDWTSSVGTTGRPQIGHSWPRSANSGMHWIADHTAPGCGAGVNTGSQNGTGTCVGCSGGYGGIYCFALTP